MAKSKTEKVDPALYSKDYFFHHCRGQDEIQGVRSGELHEVYRRAVRAAELKAGERVLDFGCGRGELVFYCANADCEVTGFDCSVDAIKIAEEIVSVLPETVRAKIEFCVGVVENIHFKKKYDVIFMIDVFEHLHDWELDALMPEIKASLTPGGRMIIQTPNLIYERFLYPAKRVLEFPFTLLKELSRLIRRTGKRKTAREFFVKLFKFQFHDDPIYAKIHINVQTPGSLKRRLAKYGFQSSIRCVDRSRNILNFLFGRWAGRTIDAIAY
ncbi:MAG TPA: class I SAM-dependent methyltransferase [Candidatus Omnitrophota bacterium]|nr:class I SAM-dependent methyltransferase [Candidatus Omnitrophota bacterium]